MIVYSSCLSLRLDLCGRIVGVFTAAAYYSSVMTDIFQPIHNRRSAIASTLLSEFISYIVPHNTVNVPTLNTSQTAQWNRLEPVPPEEAGRAATAALRVYRRRSAELCQLCPINPPAARLSP